MKPPNFLTMTPQRLHADSLFSTQGILKAYLQGALHDGTQSRMHGTHRIAQKNVEWLNLIQFVLQELGHRSWIYREGKTRDVHILETSAKFLQIDFDPEDLADIYEKIAYARGYFDAEGGVPKTPQNRFYIQICQKDREELGKVRDILEEVGISCGQIHNPSVKVDPDYWRFFVRTQSHRRFAELIGSWHPSKDAVFKTRMMI